MWTTEQFGTAHEGYVGAVLDDGAEPEPAYIDPGSGTDFHKTREWWAYSGDLNRPRATRARAACSCGWRGETECAIDWDDVDAFTAVHPSPEPRADWSQHIADVEAHTVPLPAELTTLLDQLEASLARLSDEAPLAAIKAVDVLERLTKRVAREAAFNAEADGLSDEDLGQALGVPPAEGKARLQGYHLRP
ncbi:hypothetical protein ABZ953_01285 [Streptomyces sp. NPDC046465]|uniref:hypothetical protein n=1 Tax=Streptomyces sp. NPDC046465 TaxID=3155810 RepID=UPI0033C2ED3F